MGMKNQINRGNGIFGNAICSAFLIAFVLFACVYLPHLESKRLNAARVIDAPRPKQVSARNEAASQRDTQPVVAPQPSLELRGAEMGSGHKGHDQPAETVELRPLNLDGLTVAVETPPDRIWSGHR